MKKLLFTISLLIVCSTIKSQNETSCLIIKKMISNADKMLMDNNYQGALNILRATINDTDLKNCDDIGDVESLIDSICFKYGYIEYQNNEFNNVLNIFNIEEDSTFFDVKISDTLPYWVHISKKCSGFARIGAAVFLANISQYFWSYMLNHKFYSKISQDQYIDILETTKNKIINDEWLPKKTSLKGLFVDDFLYSTQDINTGKWGYMDKNGIIIIPCQFDRIAKNFSYGFAVVQKDGLYGYLHSSGLSIWSVVMKNSDGIPISEIYNDIQKQICY